MTAVDAGPVERALDDAERDVVAAVLYSGDRGLLDDARELRPEDFGSPKLRAVWEAVLRLDARGDATDAASVSVELGRRDDKALRIDRADLVALADQSALPGAIPTYVRRVQEGSRRRQLRTVQTMLAQAETLGDPDQVLEHARRAGDVLRGAITGGQPASTPQPIAGIDLTRLDGPPQPLRFLVAERITASSLTVLGSKPGVGKSWLSQSLAIAVARGSTWLGCDIPDSRPVLYLDAENGAALAEHRLRQLGARSDLVGHLVYNTDLLSLTDTDDLARFTTTLEQLQPGLVIVDTLASHAPDAEADTESAARFYANVWSRVREAGASMLLLHHLRKSLQGARGADDILDSFRGAGHIVGAAHRIWYLEAVTPGKPVFIMREGKPREFPLNDPIRISVIDDGTGPGRTTRVELDGTLVDVEDGYDKYLATVLTYIDAHPRREGKTGDLILLPGAPPERTAKDYLTRALAAGVLHKAARGVYARAGATLPTADDEDDAA